VDRRFLERLQRAQTRALLTLATDRTPVLNTPHADVVPAASAPASTWAATRALVPLFAATLFLSSFLMFSVEPMVARQMLPVLGGVPMVWNGCVVFFQAMLLAGYGGAHLMSHGLGAPVRLLVYAALAVLPLAFARLGVDAASAGQATQSPLSWLLIALLTSVGPSFLVLAVSASTLQATFASTRHESARDPYFLYAASNAGSLAALIAYPLVVEPLLGLSAQARVWTIGYGVFVLLVLACAVVARFALGAIAFGAAPAPAGAEVAPAAVADTITWRRRARWCMLAAVPSSLMLGVTTALTTDIAPVPLLWVAPLALYLLTFIFAFGTARERATALANRFLPALLLGVAVALMLRAQLQLTPALLVHLVPFFAAAMLCHGLLAQDRPSPRHLTEFYFWLALGGMVGGLFNTLAAPMLFSRVVEYPLALAAVTLLRPRDAARGGRGAIDWILPAATGVIAAVMVFVPREAGHGPIIAAVVAACATLALARRHQTVTYAAVVGVLLLSSPWVRTASESVLHTERTFFGTYRVGLDPAAGRRSLAHGTTLHGTQRIEADRRGEPLSYYHRTGPFGRMMEAVPQLRQPGHVAAIGLGVGTLGAYAQPGQRWTFYEIDPAIERIARDDRYFTFLKDCGDRCRVVLGDARLSLAAETGVPYQLIVLDAFSSDAIPMHLLTNDAMRVYMSRLAPHGVLAFHISNRHLRLDGIVGRLAAANGMVALERSDRKMSAGWSKDKSASHWMMTARSPEDLGALTQDPEWTAPRVGAGVPLWTDDFSNILDVLQIRLR
jgi:hypothetical protein